jgi:hypothetical protein
MHAFTARLMVDLAGKPVHELFDIVCEKRSVGRLGGRSVGWFERWTV